MSPKMGQKLTDNPRNVRLEVRLTQEENALLEECAKRLQVTKTKVITKGIELVDKDSRNQKNSRSTDQSTNDCLSNQKSHIW